METWSDGTPALPQPHYHPVSSGGTTFATWSTNIKLQIRLRDARILAMVTVEDPTAAAPLAKALTAGGIRAVELALRTLAALDALRAFRREAPEVLLGAGTVLWPHQLDAVQEAGADFGLALGIDLAVVRHSATTGLPFFYGITTTKGGRRAYAC
ncbi:MAG: putative aldolase [Verrucomicrobiota bacterium]|jgi:2-dehydro-3-deoxyphosphogluconate aldolase/(4S)-4-hydroxy-2-oxoglutarate aldolase